MYACGREPVAAGSKASVFPSGHPSVGGSNPGPARENPLYYSSRRTESGNPKLRVGNAAASRSCCWRDRWKGEGAGRALWFLRGKAIPVEFQDSLTNKRGEDDRGRRRGRNRKHTQDKPTTTDSDQRPKTKDRRTSTKHRPLGRVLLGTPQEAYHDDDERRPGRGKREEPKKKKKKKKKE